jgi:hypothetical protein
VAEFDSVIPPGGTGKIVAEVKTNNISGRRSKSVRVESNDPARRNTVLTLSFEVRTPIDVYPRPTLMLNGVQGQELSETVIIHRTDGQPLELSGPKVNRPGLDVTLEKVTEETADPPARPRGARPGDYRLTAKLAEPSGQRNETITLQFETNHPERERLVIPVRVSQRALVTPIPRRVTLHHRGERTVGRATFRHGALRPFEVESVEITGGVEGLSARVLSDRPQATQVVEVALDNGALEPGTYNATLVARTSLERLPLVKVPVLVRVHQPRTTAAHP